MDQKNKYEMYLHPSDLYLHANRRRKYQSQKINQEIYAELL